MTAPLTRHELLAIWSIVNTAHPGHHLAQRLKDLLDAARAADPEGAQE